MPHYYAVAERHDGETSWWISFPGLDGVTSGTDDAGQIVAQAQDALASTLMWGGALPTSIEDGATPPQDLSGYDNPLVVVIPFSPAAAKEAA